MWLWTVLPPWSLSVLTRGNSSFLRQLDRPLPTFPMFVNYSLECHCPPGLGPAGEEQWGHTELAKFWTEAQRLAFQPQSTLSLEKLVPRLFLFHSLQGTEPRVSCMLRKCSLSHRPVFSSLLYAIILRETLGKLPRLVSDSLCTQVLGL